MTCEALVRHAATAALALAFAGSAHGAGERLTQECNTNFGVGEVILPSLPAAALSNILALVANPGLDPDVYHRLWRPKHGAVFSDGVILGYDAIQDTEQITVEIRSDPVLAAVGIGDAWPNTEGICFSPGPPPARIVITEYFNTVLGHYFLSSSALENGVIDTGGAGPGWSRTGETFDAIASGYCDHSRPIFRFYNRGANTHFFTVDTLECGGLRRTDPGWFFEAEAFGANPPSGGACPGKTTPIYRLYNNRWMFNDSNHRFVGRLDLYELMKARGWVGEGIAMCLDKTGSDWWQTN